MRVSLVRLRPRIQREHPLNSSGLQIKGSGAIKLIEIQPGEAPPKNSKGAPFEFFVDIARGNEP